jgi:hypothetical protein
MQNAAVIEIKSRNHGAVVIAALEHLGDFQQLHLAALDLLGIAGD